jgi:hypothetical protein
VTQAGAVWPTLAAFRADNSRWATSREVTFGSEWYTNRLDPPWRSSWIQATGEFIIMQLTGTQEAQHGPVELLGVAGAAQPCRRAAAGKLRPAADQVGGDLPVAGVFGGHLGGAGDGGHRVRAVAVRDPVGDPGWDDCAVGGQQVGDEPSVRKDVEVQVLPPTPPLTSENAPLAGAFSCLEGRAPVARSSRFSRTLLHGISVPRCVLVAGGRRLVACRHGRCDRLQRSDRGERRPR